MYHPHFPRTSSLDEEEGKYHKRRRRWSPGGDAWPVAPSTVVLTVVGLLLLFVVLRRGSAPAAVAVAGGADDGGRADADAVRRAAARRERAAHADEEGGDASDDGGQPAEREREDNEGDGEQQGGDDELARRADEADATPVEDLGAVGPSAARASRPLPRAGEAEKLLTFTFVNMATEQKPWLQKTLLNKQRYVRRHGYSWELHLETLAENDPVWSKIPAMELALFGCSSIPRERLDLPVPPGSADWSTKKPVPVPKGGREHWAWWFDIDTLITNYSVSLASIVVAAKEVHRENHKGKKDAPDLEMILSRDCNGLNAGSLLLRRSPWVQRFLALLWSMRDELPKIDKDKRSEQDALAYLYKTKEDVRARAAFLPQTVLNGNPEDISCLEWFEGTGESGRPWKRGDFTWHIAGSWAHTDNIMKRNGIKEDSEQAKNFEGSEFLFAKYWPQVVEE